MWPFKGKRIKIFIPMQDFMIKKGIGAIEKAIIYLVIVILISAVARCGLATKKIKLKSQSEKTDFLIEVNEEGIPAKGYVDLLIKTSIKTHLEGYYFMEPRKTFHGQEGYPIVMNIDGQAITWKLKGQKETIPREKGTNNPKEGQGMRYRINKRIRLAPGLHKIFFGFPGEKIYKEINLTLMEDNVNILEFKPIYLTRGGTTRSFLNEVHRGEMIFNGNVLR